MHLKFVDREIACAVGIFRKRKCCFTYIIIIIIFIYLPSDVISQEKKLQLPLGLSPKHRNMQFL